MRMYILSIADENIAEVCNATLVSGHKERIRS